MRSMPEDRARAQAKDTGAPHKGVVACTYAIDWPKGDGCGIAIDVDSGAKSLEKSTAPKKGEAGKA